VEEQSIFALGFLSPKGDMTMQEEIGTAAGSIWQALNTRGELSLAQLKKEVKAKTPLFDWAIGWLAREDRIAITPETSVTPTASFRPKSQQSYSCR
jgi:hypothetical protein